MNLKVLIDTWWNVNYQFLVKSTSHLNVLIDTWWNVNAVTVEVDYTADGF